MIRTTLTLACAIVALAITANANAQCSSCGTAGGYATGGYATGGYAGITNYGGYGGFGMADAGVDNCGRQISNQGAAGLWAGYCSESCVGGRFGGKARGCGKRGCGSNGKFGYPGGACGRNSCFGYPSCGGCGGGCGGGAGIGGSFFGHHRGHGGCSLFSKVRGRHAGFGGGCSLFKKHSSCGLGFGGGFGHGGGCGSSCGLGGFSGFGLFAKHRSGSGCKLFGKCKGRRTQYAAVITQPVTTVAVDQCGCGNSGQYFNYAVGAEYGTAGMQSGVSQVLSGSSCCGGSANTVLDAGVQMYENTGHMGIMQ